MSAERISDAAWTRRGGQRPNRVRIVHLGLGNFHRAHQAWYTSAAADWRDWGIAAFSGRSPRQAEILTAQDGLYCLDVTGVDSSEVIVVPSILEAIDGARVDRLAELLADPAVAIVTLTITEAGYRLALDGSPDQDDPVLINDIALMREAARHGSLDGARPESTLGRLLVGLDARAHVGAIAISVVSCDNIPDNGRFLRQGLVALAARVSQGLADWIDRNVDFVSTSIDRITPRVDLPLKSVADAGWNDSAAVATEEFSDWVLSGDFPAGRPAWESAGARFVDDIEPWETRKLWLLNGAHSILAFAGLKRGFKTVADAIADDECRALVTGFWAEAVTHLPPEIEHLSYRAELIDRFSNRRIEHRLQQIAEDSTAKARIRFAAVAERSLAAGGDARGSAAAIATWIRAVSASILPPPNDVSADADPRELLTALSPALSGDEDFSRLVAELAARRSHEPAT